MTASETSGVVTIANTGTGTVSVPVTVPPGTTVSRPASLQAYGGALSNWLSVPGSSSQTLTEKVAPAITTASSANSILGTAFSFTVTSTGTPAPKLTRTGKLPRGITFTASSNGTATLSGTPTAPGSYPVTFTARNSAGTISQAFTLTVATPPASAAQHRRPWQAAGKHAVSARYGIHRHHPR